MISHSTKVNNKRSRDEKVNNTRFEVAKKRRREEINSSLPESSAAESNGDSLKCRKNMYTQTGSISQPGKNSKNNTQTSAQSSPLLLPSCSYIDLTVLQAKCGPGFKANFDKSNGNLHHSVFFDKASNNIIYAVHQEKR